MKKAYKFGIMGGLFILLLVTSALSASAASSYVVYGKVTYGGSYTNDITVTVNLSYNSTIYETATDVTYGGGKYQVNLANFALVWNTSMSVTVNATHSSKSKSSSFNIASGESMKNVNLVLSTAGSSSEDTSYTRPASGSNTGLAITAVAMLGCALVFILIYALFHTSLKPQGYIPPQRPIVQKKQVKRKTTKRKTTKKKPVKRKLTKSYKKGNVEMEEVFPINNKW